MVRNLDQKNIRVVNGKLYVRRLARRVPGKPDRYEWMPQTQSYESYMRRYHT
jgi:hypothetical protein